MTNIFELLIKNELLIILKLLIEINRSVGANCRLNGGGEGGGGGGRDDKLRGGYCIT